MTLAGATDVDCTILNLLKERIQLAKDKHNLKNFVVKRFLSMFEPGRSKYRDKKENHGKPRKDKIYSFKTYQLYKKICQRGIVLLVKWHGKHDDLDAYRPFVGELLQYYIDRGLAPSTVRTYSCAWGKLFGCSMNDFGVEIPIVKKQENTKNRINYYTLYVDMAKYPDIVLVAQAFGIRKMSFSLHPSQVQRKADGTVWLVAYRSKGGQICDTQALPQYAEAVWNLAQQRLREGAQYLTRKPTMAMPIHQYRTLFARELHDLVKRPIELLDEKELHYAYGMTFDKQALQIVSEALSHHRFYVTVDYLIRDFVRYSQEELLEMREAKRKARQEAIAAEKEMVVDMSLACLVMNNCKCTLEDM